MNQQEAIFAVALTEHRYIGYVFVPYIIRLNERGTFYIPDSLVLHQDVKINEERFTNQQIELVNLIDQFSDEKLTRKFSRERSSKEFFQNTDKDYFYKNIAPYIDRKMAACVDLIKNSSTPLFLKLGKYANFYNEDRIDILPDEAETVFHFNLQPEGLSYQLTVEYNDVPIGILNRKPLFVVNEPCHMVLNHKLYRFRNVSARKLAPFIERTRLSIPSNTIDKYMKSFVLNTIKGNTVNANGFDIIMVDAAHKAIIVLETGLDLEPMLTLRFEYGSKQFLAGKKGDVEVELKVEKGRYIFYKHARDLKWEKEQLAFLESLGVKLSASQLVLNREQNPFGDQLRYLTINWLNRNSSLLKEKGFVVEQQMDVERYYLGLQNIEFKINEATDWFDLYMLVRFGDFEIPFYKFKSHILSKQREFELPNGEKTILPLEWFTRYSSLLAFARNSSKGMQISKHHFSLLLEHQQAMEPELLEKISSLKTASFQLLETPNGVNARLRSYQTTGFSWLHYLGLNLFGGCLADDMGLGKTLQTLALLQKNKNLHLVAPKNNKGSVVQQSLFPEEHCSLPASLIVLPTSLIHNWHNEIMKFVPSLKTVIYTGTSRKKSDSLLELTHNCDVILTTYGIVRNDIEMLKECSFNYVILDESQNIKNSESKIFQAACQLEARVRLTLTGTPLENSLSDLWAQFHFINPGLLGTHHFFKNHFLIPIEKEGNDERREELQRLIHPFILRRTKEEVAADLPPLTEQVILCEMTDSQRERYESVKSTIRNNLLNNMEGQTRDRWAFIAIQAMTRLRQLANHPLLVGEPDIDSGKFSEVMEHLSNLMAEEHKVLLFSSFVKHLKIFESEFVRLGWGFSMLTGQTRDRKEVIDAFQTNPDKRIFLISLKAGGVGLNLTAADYIFILDPWWNPAAEAQAVSRAHRIGQDKKVFVYKFITEASIEEKMMKLKERKLALADQFVNSNNPMKSISEGELMELLD